MVSEIVYQNCKIYGPYFRKDGRKHIIAIFPDKKRKTVSYPKYLVEVNLNRYLDENETVDHIDGNFENNALLNLRVIDRAQHIREDVKRNASQIFRCPICKIDFALSGSEISNAKENRRKNKAGPFCSRRCVGVYGSDVQNNKRKKLDVVKIKNKYTSLKKQSAFQEIEKM